MEESQYKTLAELCGAYKSGELTPETAVMRIDNDFVAVTWHAADDLEWEQAVDVFEMDPHDLQEQALDLLGIPHEHV